MRRDNGNCNIRFLITSLALHLLLLPGLAQLAGAALLRLLQHLGDHRQLPPVRHRLGHLRPPAERVENVEECDCYVDEDDKREERICG